MKLLRDGVTPCNAIIDGSIVLGIIIPLLLTELGQSDYWLFVSIGFVTLLVIRSWLCVRKKGKL